MPTSPQDIYARHLLSPRGYPLWTPEPSNQLLAYRPNGLRIGDVGVVIPEDGCFDVFFNLCLPEEHPFHQATGVPDNFTPIRLSDTDIRTVANAENPGRIISTSSVKTVRVPGQLRGSPSSARSAGLKYDFTLSSGEGALLILPDGAERHDLRNNHRFLEAAKNHGVDWYRFAQEKVGQIIGDDSLYLITGLCKTRFWSLAAFEETEESGEYPARLWLTQPGSGGDNIRAACTWETTRGIDWRVGPLDNYGNPNQSVFIRGFKIAHRTGIFGKKQIVVKVEPPLSRPSTMKSAGAAPGDSWLAYSFGGLSTGRPAGSSGSSIQNTTRSNPKFETAQDKIQNNGAPAVGKGTVVRRMPGVSQAFHPCDVINRYLLKKEPSVSIAITHDDEWISLLEKNLLRPEDIVEKELLERQVSLSYYAITDGGAVYLRSRNSILRRSNTGETDMTLEEPDAKSETSSITLYDFAGQGYTTAPQSPISSRRYPVSDQMSESSSTITSPSLSDSEDHEEAYFLPDKKSTSPQMSYRGFRQATKSPPSLLEKTLKAQSSYAKMHSPGSPGSSQVERTVSPPNHSFEPSPYIEIVKPTIYLDSFLATSPNGQAMNRQWNVCFPAVARDFGMLSSRSWMEVRNKPATKPPSNHITIICREFPGEIHIYPQGNVPTVGVTCGEVLDAIYAFLHADMDCEEYKRFGTTARLKNGTVSRYHWLHSKLYFGGLTMNEALVEERFGKVLPAVFEMTCFVKP